MALFTIFPWRLQATDYYWNEPGAGVWDLSTANWSTNSAGGTPTLWQNSATSNDAIFSAGTGTTGTFDVTITGVDIFLDDLIFQEGAITLKGAAGGTLSIRNGGGGVVDGAAGGIRIEATSGAVTFDSSLGLINTSSISSQKWENLSSSVFTVNSNVQIRNAARVLTLLPGTAGIRINGIMSLGHNDAAISVGSGSGAVTLTNTNTYIGTTTITSGGVLLLSSTGSLASATNNLVTVETGGILGGNGVVNANTVINGSLAPQTVDGGSIGTLNINNDLTWNGSTGQDWQFELGAVSGSSDQLLFTGAGNDFLRGTGAAGDWNFNFMNTGVEGVFTLVDWASSTTFLASDFTYSGLASGFTGEFSINGTQLDFTVTPIPEPSAWVLLAAGLGLGVVGRRRRA